MNSIEEADPKRNPRQWLFAALGLLFCVGALWLASAISSYPQEAISIARQFGPFLWIIAALSAWVFYKRKKSAQSRPRDKDA
jgi:protein-S-isoprenylcysteine O-methyltransferase Ste14